jgi:hypothetical protein
MGKTKVSQLADYFLKRPLVWIDGRTLATIGGAWRSRVSDVRRSPFNLTIENRQRHVRVDDQAFTISEYRYRPDDRPAVSPPVAPHWELTP